MAKLTSIDRMMTMMRDGSIRRIMIYKSISAMGKLNNKNMMTMMRNIMRDKVYL